MKFRNTAALWSAVFIQTLKNCGVRTLVVSSGAQSVPLTLAGAEIFGESAVIPALDERSAGFFALGLAKSTARPVALVCTSGTAVANCLPAVVEARMSRTPLIVVSADRAPELQNRHVGQTIPQSGIFSHFTIYEENCVPAPAFASLEAARSAAQNAFARSVEASAPAHVNVQFREPVAPAVAEKNFPPSEAFPPDFALEKFDLTEFCAVKKPPLRDFFKKIALPADLARALGADALAGKKVLIVAGTTPPGQDDAFFVDALSRRLAAPILADATHPLRRFPPARERLIERYDAIFKTAEKPYAEDFSALRPDVIFQLGTLPENKFLRAELGTLRETPVFLFNFCGDNTDALCRPRAVRVPVRFRDVFGGVFENLSSGTTVGGNGVAARTASPEEQKFLAAWKAADERFKVKSDEYFRNAAAGATASAAPTEPQIARFLCENVFEAETAIFVANGMAVRDMNSFCPAGTRFWLFHNRGANGIDGTLSTALGVAHGCMEQTILYTGDLSLLHDTNGFLLAPHFCGNLTIVLQNNGGGNIFRHLPVAKENPFFERLLLMPQRADFGKLAAAYGVDYARAETLAELKRWLRRFRSHQGIHMIEIRTDGEASRRIRAELSR